jgi:hypothetical protein
MDENRADKLAIWSLYITDPRLLLRFIISVLHRMADELYAKTTRTIPVAEAARVHQAGADVSAVSGWIKLPDGTQRLAPLGMDRDTYAHTVVAPIYRDVEIVRNYTLEVYGAACAPSAQYRVLAVNAAQLLQSVDDMPVCFFIMYLVHAGVLRSLMPTDPWIADHFDMSALLRHTSHVNHIFITHRFYNIMREWTRQSDTH